MHRFFKKLKSKYNNYFLKSVLIFSFILIIFLSNFIVHKLNIHNNNISEKNKGLKTNDSEIIILTPEDITYTEPMEGHYLGKDSDFIDLYYTIGNSSISLVDSYNGHNNVLRLYVDSKFDFTTMRNYLEGGAQEDEIIEYYYAPASNGSTNAATYLYTKEEGEELVQMRMGWKYGDLEYYSGGKWNILTNGTFSLGNWYHIKIITNDSADTYEVYINSSLIGSSIPYTSPSIIGADSMEIASDSLNQTLECYIDAIGLPNRDPYYKEGDNLEKGFFISYTNTTALNWTGYSLDGQVNRTILRNTTIPLPKNGQHTIQLFGNSTLGTYYASDIREFIVDYHPIEIITPENKSYTEPMKGHFPGKDSDFMDLYSALGSSSISLVDSYNGHNNVLRIEVGPSELTFMDCFLEGGAQENEIIEFYYAPAYNGSVDSTFFYTMEQLNKLVQMRWGWNYGDLEYYAGGKWNIITNDIFSLGKWYHIKIITDDSANNYEVYVNGELMGSSIPYTTSSIIGADRVTFGSTSLDQSLECYIDAIGLPNRDLYYKEGDNLREGLLFSYRSSTNLEWIGYTLDGNNNQTISGNTTISLPENGPHTLQVFGNSSSGNYYTSKIREFTVNYYPIKIISPENKIYSEPMRGYYPATYGFEKDELGNFPNDWGIFEYGGGIARVVEIKDTHKKVLELYDNVPAAGQSVVLNNTFSEQNYGTVEFWICSDDISKSSGFSIRNGNTIITGFSIDNGQFYTTIQGGSYAIPGLTVVNDLFYQIRIDFELTTGSYMGLSQNRCQFIIDGNPFGPFEMYNILPVNLVSLETYSYDGDYSSFYDAIGYSWDPDYNIGDNLNEGLLLSYTSTIQLDWMEYSLDGQSNRTILGNTTIQFPEIGQHTIQVFGNTSSGSYYTSDIRQFIIDLSPPSIIGIDIVIEIELNSICKIQWTLTDESGGIYMILINKQIESIGEFTNNEIISIIVDTSKVGYFNYTIIAIDPSDKSTSHSVIVHVKHKDTESKIPGYNIIILLAILSLFICIINYLMRSKFRIKI